MLSTTLNHPFAHRGWAAPLLLVLTMTALSACANGGATRAGAGRAGSALYQTGKIEGSLFTNGKEEKLKHVVVITRAGTDRDGKEYGGSRGTAPATVAVLIASNVALSAQQLAQLANGTYKGSDKVRGITATIDLSNPHHWYAETIMQYGTLYHYGMTSAGGEVKVDNNRMTGQLAYNNQDETGTRRFMIGIDAPVNITVSPLLPDPAEQKISEPVQ